MFPCSEGHLQLPSIVCRTHTFGVHEMAEGGIWIGLGFTAVTMITIKDFLYYQPVSKKIGMVLDLYC